MQGIHISTDWLFSFLFFHLSLPPFHSLSFFFTISPLVLPPSLFLFLFLSLPPSHFLLNYPFCKCSVTQVYCHYVQHIHNRNLKKKGDTQLKWKRKVSLESQLRQRVFYWSRHVKEGFPEADTGESQVLKQTHEKAQDVKKDPTEGGQCWKVLVCLVIPQWPSFIITS